MRTVNVHEAKTHFSRLIDAYGGETIPVAKDGTPWARRVPLEPDQPRRQQGCCAGSCGFLRPKNGSPLCLPRNSTPSTP